MDHSAKGRQGNPAGRATTGICALRRQTMLATELRRPASAVPWQRAVATVVADGLAAAGAPSEPLGLGGGLVRVRRRFELGGAVRLIV
jgi:hypothetical protein